jgi:hypothetical protein
VRVNTKDVNYKGYVHHASSDDPQYEIKRTRPIILLYIRVEYYGRFLIDPRHPPRGYGKQDLRSVRT